MKEKTKIVLCITKSNWGGAQKYVYNLAISLPEKLYDVVVVCGGNGEMIEKLKRLNIRVIRLHEMQRDIGLSKDFKSLRELISIVKKENPDIVHSNSSKMGLLVNFAVLYVNVSRRVKSTFSKINNKKIKTVFTAHGWAFNEDRSFTQKTILRMLQVLTIQLCDKTIVVAETLRRQINIKDNSEKIITIYNGIESIPFKTKKSAREEISLLTKKKFLPKTNWIGTISELHKNKGLVFALEAFSIVKNRLREKEIKFFIIGEGEERRNLEKIIKEKRLHDDVFLLGYIPKAEELLKAFDIFTLTSKTEALPYVLLEAGQASLPIVASDVGGIPEIIDDEESGLLARPKNPKEISMMLEHLLLDKTKASLYGKKIKEKVSKRFTIKESTKKTFLLYLELLK